MMSSTDIGPLLPEKGSGIEGRELRKPKPNGERKKLCEELVDGEGRGTSTFSGRRNPGIVEVTSSGSGTGGGPREDLSLS